MSRTDLRKLMPNIIILITLVIYLIFITDVHLLNTVTGQDPQATIRHQHREARYNSEDYQFWKQFFRERNGQWSKRKDGSHNEAHYHFVEDKNLADSAQVASLRNEMMSERTRLVCKSDLVVKGEVIKAQAVITDDDLFIYTVYTFLITDLLRAGAGISNQPGDLIEFTTPGGQANIEDRKVTFNYPGFEPLQINDQYVVQLTNDAAASDYYISSNLSIYLLEGEKITRMDARTWPFYAEQARVTQAPTDFDTLKTEIQSANCQ